MTTALIVAVVGGLIYIASWFDDSRIGDALGELGRLAFFAGLLAYLIK